MRSPTNWAVLGLLIERPGHGYDLRQRMEREYEGVLAPHESQIYDALEALECRGFIEEAPGSQALSAGSDRRLKVTYRTTDDGVLAFEKHLLGQMLEDRRQSRIFLRQLAVLAHTPEAGLRVVERLEQEYAEEARNVPIAVPSVPRANVVAALVERFVTEERRLAMEAKLPLARFIRREFEALAASKARRESA